jgi:hypothetical protein
MTGHLKLLGALMASGLLALSVLPARALTAQECSAKYQAAKSAGTLNGQKWNDFRKAECGAGAAAATTPAAAPAAAAAAAPAATAARPAPRTATAPAAPVGNAIFPSAVSPKYANESAGKAREHTCLDQSQANKATNTNGGLKWIMKGGGYYSECNKRLKGV